MLINIYIDSEDFEITKKDFGVQFDYVIPLTGIGNTHFMINI